MSQEEFSLSIVGVVFTIFGACCLNVVVLEMLIKEAPGSANIITFAQFLFISFYGFIFTSKFETIQPKIPRNVSNNYALTFNIPMPLHMIFKSGSLVASLIMGKVVLKNKYSFKKHLGVLMITLGVIMCTFASVPQHMKHESKLRESHFITWLFGVFLMAFSLFLGGYMGICQETMYRKYGKHSKEALYYTNIWNYVITFNKSPMLYFIPIPRLWFFLLLNIVTQYVCVSSVFRLSTLVSSLSVNLVVTLRKFISLLISILYFHNVFSTYHWMGTALVFVGTFIYIHDSYLHTSVEAKNK